MLMCYSSMPWTLCWHTLLVKGVSEPLHQLVMHYRDITYITPLIARFIGPTWGPSGADRTQAGPMLAPWTLLSETCIWLCNSILVWYNIWPHNLMSKEMLSSQVVLIQFIRHTFLFHFVSISIPLSKNSLWLYKFVKTKVFMHHSSLPSLLFLDCYRCLSNVNKNIRLQQRSCLDRQEAVLPFWCNFHIHFWKGI